MQRQQELILSLSIVLQDPMAALDATLGFPTLTSSTIKNVGQILRPAFAWVRVEAAFVGYLRISNLRKHLCRSFYIFFLASGVITLTRRSRKYTSVVRPLLWPRNFWASPPLRSTSVPPAARKSWKCAFSTPAALQAAFQWSRKVPGRNG